MDFFVIRNHRQLTELCENLQKRRLPCKVALQDIYPKRSIDLNDYLWGFIYTPIAEYTGHSIIEVHEGYKKLFNFRVDFEYNTKTKKYELAVEVGSTTTLDMKECWDYASKIRADAELDLHLTLHLPNECFIPEMDFEFENSYELRRI